MAGYLDTDTEEIVVKIVYAGVPIGDEFRAAWANGLTINLDTEFVGGTIGFYKDDNHLKCKYDVRSGMSLSKRSFDGDVNVIPWPGTPKH